MTRGMRLLIVFCVFIGVIMLMMDCAKKTMRKKQTGGAEGESQGRMVPEAESRPAFGRG